MKGILYSICIGSLTLALTAQGQGNEGRGQCRRESEGAAECARDDLGKYTRGGERYATAWKHACRPLSSTQFRGGASAYARDR